MELDGDTRQIAGSDERAFGSQWGSDRHEGRAQAVGRKGAGRAAPCTLQPASLFRNYLWLVSCAPQDLAGQRSGHFSIFNYGRAIHENEVHAFR